MCFTIDPCDPHEHTADRDIPCFKFLIHRDGKYLAPFYSTEYALVRDRSVHAVDRNQKRLTELWTGSADSEIYEGLHSYRDLTADLHSAAVLFDAVVAVFVIPAGTPYYQNQKDRVSLELRFVQLAEGYFYKTTPARTSPRPSAGSGEPKYATTAVVTCQTNQNQNQK
jgi:hypothetical protein